MSETRYITRKQLKARYGGVSDMTIWRWEHDPELGFPTAVEINGRKYFDLALVEEWERRRAAHSSRRAA
jgi:predicted DNA-binding transcriptional regulator AlpA